jgi:tRNA A-37 threonylcarbamoyl transferase component Bud32
MAEELRIEPIEPPTETAELLRGEWVTPVDPDLMTLHLTVHYWDGTGDPNWEVARLSQAAYAYRETTTGWSAVAKFYVVKTSSDAGRHAANELAQIQAAQAAQLAEGALRTVRPLGLWRGTLLLEHVDGLTLEDVIAVRRSRPGTLTDRLRRAAQLLATLHTHGARPEAPVDFASQVAYAHGVVHDLVRWGVLKHDPVTADGLSRLIDHWAGLSSMEAYTPTLNHGDATTTNFIFPWEGGVVMIDWERMESGDPASDLGRLMAELGHSIQQHGGTVTEAVPAIQHLTDAYREALPAGWDHDAVIERAQFYRASSMLRIARNGWVSRLDRTALVARAMALLSKTK